MADLDQRTRNFLQWYEKKEEEYSEFAQCVLKKLLDSLKERKIIHAYHSCRAKKIASLTDKCAKKEYDEITNSYTMKYNDPRNQITDLAGVRIVCYLPQDILPIQHLVESLFAVDSDNSMNKADLLKQNQVGYLSVHYIVSLKEEYLSGEQRKFKGMKCEIQLRTVLQDAWSQVFHDRQYKSNMANAEIPMDLLRETNLVSGALELLDHEIGRLVQKYDSMGKIINNTVYQELLDRFIDKESLEEYFKIKFVRMGTRFYSYDDISSVLKKYGLVTIRDIDSMLDDGLIQEIYALNMQLTIDKILMYGMIINDADKFFGLEENKEVVISQEAYDLLGKFIDIGSMCNKYNLKIKE